MDGGRSVGGPLTTAFGRARLTPCQLEEASVPMPLACPTQDIRGVHSSGPKDLLSDRCVLSCPSMDLVTCLLDFRLNLASNRSIVPRLAASLAACAQLSALGKWHHDCHHACRTPRESGRAPDVFCLLSAAASHRMWALQRLRKLLTTEFGQSINIHRLLGDNDGEARALVWSRNTRSPDAWPSGNKMLVWSFKLGTPTLE